MVIICGRLFHFLPYVNDEMQTSGYTRTPFIYFSTKRLTIDDTILHITLSLNASQFGAGLPVYPQYALSQKILRLLNLFKAVYNVF